MFIDIRLPEDISYGAIGGPEFSTDVIALNNGHEHRNINWDYPRHRYQVNYDVLSVEMVRDLLKFFLIVKGRAHSFRFKDWLDHEARGEVFRRRKLININDKKKGDSNISNNQQFQLFKTYKLGKSIYTRMITKPVKGSIVIKNSSNVKLREALDYEIDYQRGIVSLKQDTVQDLFLDFDFDVCARFDNDYCDLSINHMEIYGWKSVKLVEVMD